MKSFLFFKINGEIEKKTTKCKIFTDSSEGIILDVEIKFTHYVKYENYIILHNNDSNKELNKTVFYFTTDRFNGDIALIKIGTNNLIKNLLIDDYFKKLTKKLQGTININSSSDSESDIDLSIYGKILTKEPFEY